MAGAYRVATSAGGNTMADFEFNEGTAAEENMDLDNMTLDLADLDDTTGFEAMPKGEYECIVDDVDFGMSKSDNPMVTWKFKVADPDHPDYAKRLLFFYNVLNQELGRKFLKKTLVALGLTEQLNGFNPKEFCDNGDAIGLPIRVKVGINKYEGEKRNNVKDVLPSAESSDLI